MCLYNPLLDVINHIACDCTGDASAPPDCYPGMLPFISKLITDISSKPSNITVLIFIVFFPGFVLYNHNITYTPI